MLKTAAKLNQPIDMKEVVSQHYLFLRSSQGLLSSNPEPEGDDLAPKGDELGPYKLQYAKDDGQY